MNKYDTIEDYEGINWGWGDKKVLEILKRLSKTLDPSTALKNPIKWCAYYGLTESVKFLMKDKRIDPTINDNELIGSAVNSGNMGTVKAVLSNKDVDPSANNYYAPYLAFSQNDIDICELLLTRCDLSQKALINGMPTKYINDSEFINLVRKEITDRKGKKIGKFKDFLDL